MKQLGERKGATQVGHVVHHHQQRDLQRVGIQGSSGDHMRRGRMQHTTHAEAAKHCTTRHHAGQNNHPVSSRAQSSPYQEAHRAEAAKDCAWRQPACRHHHQQARQVEQHAKEVEKEVLLRRSGRRARKYRSGGAEAQAWAWSHPPEK